jgi:hypothetical protein
MATPEETEIRPVDDGPVPLSELTEGPDRFIAAVIPELEYAGDDPDKPLAWDPNS